MRGRGHGLRVWNAAIAHAGPRVIGLDGVVAQQQNYKKSGFKRAYANVRYGGTVAAPDAQRAGVIAMAEVPLTFVEAYDATVFPAPRTAAPGLARPDMSRAHSCATDNSPLGA